MEEYRYKKYWNAKWDTKLYECLIWSKFLKEKQKKTDKIDNTEKKLKIFRIILYAWIWIIALITIIAVIYSLIN